MTADTCLTCRGTGVTHRAPYMVGLRDGDLYTITVCTCEAGQGLARQIEAELARTEAPHTQRHLGQIEGMEDLMHRLEEAANDTHFIDHETAREAADRIRGLEAEVSRLRAEVERNAGIAIRALERAAAGAAEIARLVAQMEGRDYEC